MATAPIWQALCEVLASADSLAALGAGLSQVTGGAPIRFERHGDGGWDAVGTATPPGGRAHLDLGGWGRLCTSAAAKRQLAPATAALTAAVTRLTAPAPVRPSRRPAAAANASQQEQVQTLLDSLMNTSPAGIALTDASGRMIRYNRRFLTLFGYEEGVPLGMDVGRLQRCFADGRRFGRWLQELPELPGRTQELDLRQVTPEARQLIVLSSPAHTADGRFTGRLFHFRDITQQANVDRMKTELINVVSHELRTPLTSVLGFAELVLIRDLPTDKVRQYVGTIYTEGKRLSALLDDFLDINRLESRQQPYHMRPVTLAPLVRKVAAIFASDEAHPVVIDLPPSLPTVRADGDRLQQALTNLISNAVKYSPAGGPVRIGAEWQADQQRVVVQVSDQGLGIPEAALGQLFSKFFRAHHPGHEGIGGTGLGLAIVHEIIRAHGGDVWVESREGVGSTFSFTLPVRNRTARQAPATADGA